MTLNEAIKHCKEVARTNNCVKCKREHKQLAKWLEDYKKLLQKKKKQIFHIDDTVYMIDEDNRYFEDKIYKIEKLNGNYYYYGSNCDFEEKDIGDWVFESELYRELHLESIIEMNYDLP